METDAQSLFQSMNIGILNILILSAVTIGMLVVIIAFIRNVRENEKILEQKVVERTAQLREKTKDIDNMLQNLSQGIITIVDDSSIHHEYSIFMESIFETKNISGRNVMELVFSNSNVGSDLQHQIEETIAACIGEDVLNFELNKDLLVCDFDLTLSSDFIKNLALSWHPICDENDEVTKLMVSVRDVTELKALESETNRQKKELEIIGQIVAISQEKFHDFVETSNKFLDENKKIIKETREKDSDTISVLFRNMHTIKGNARTYGFIHLTNAVHETEQGYDLLRSDPDEKWDRVSLLAKLNMVRENIENYAEINDVKLGRKGPGRRKGSIEKYLMIEKAQMEQMLKELEEIDYSDMNEARKVVVRSTNILSLIGTVSLEEILSSIVASMSSLAIDLGKPEPGVTIVDNSIYLKNQISGLLKNCFMHMFRNSIDHGLEDVKERIENGKKERGQIRVEMSHENGKLVFRYSDDGRGLNIKKIKDKAMKLKLIPAESSLSDYEIAQFIFTSGMTTAEKLTDVSGRGVGMDSVKKFLEQEKGTIDIKFRDSDGESEYQPFDAIVTLPIENSKAIVS